MPRKKATKKTPSKKPNAILKKQRVWFGNPKLEMWLVPIEKLKPKPNNTRKHTPQSTAGVIESLTEFGQQSPIIIDGDAVVQKGNGTMIAAKRMGWTHLAALPTNIKEAKRLEVYSAVDNRTSELSVWDVPGLSKALQKHYDSLKPERWVKWWDEYELQPLMKANWAPPAPTKSMPGTDQEDQVRMAAPIHVTAMQRLTLDRVFAEVRAQEGDDTIKEGRIVELIFADWLSGNKELKEIEQETE